VHLPTEHPGDMRDESAVEVSIVMPCLNEAGTVGHCVAEAQRALAESGIAGEIVVADNGSTDGSAALAARHGARVVTVPDRGYGCALMGGIAAARGKFVVMGDADQSYDFGDVPRFVAKLREGYDLVQGCRLESGGGRILPHAMPFLHRWVGNPLFSLLVRAWFRAPIHDIHCGMRAFTTDLYRRLDQRCTGMEFASEMIVKAALGSARIAELPITLRPDGRGGQRSHLRTLRDGWRHLRFLLLFSPRWLFLLPGAALVLLGLAGYAIALPGLTLGGVTFDVHTLLLASLAIVCGHQAILFAVFTKTFAIDAGLLPADPRMTRLLRLANLERGLVTGGLGTLAGVALLAVAVDQWRRSGFGPLDYAQTMRWVIPGALLTTLGVQTVLSSFFLSILGMQRR
jgi:glycosyltransferase involved in cell wall biosynthesis